MKTLHTVLAATLVASTFTSCSDDAASADGNARGAIQADGSFQPAGVRTQSVAADAGKLIPDNVVGVVHIRSIEGLQSKVKALVGAIQPGGEGMVDQLLAPLIQLTGLREGDLKLSESGTVALGMTPMGPMPTFIVAAKNASESADVTGLPAAASGDYLGIGMAAEPKIGSATPKLATGLPDGDIAIRIDLATLIQATRPMIEQGLDPKALPMPLDGQQAAVISGMMEGIKSLLDSAKGLDLDVSLVDGTLKIGFSFEGGDGKSPTSKVSGVGPVGLARMLPKKDAALIMLGNANAERLLDGLIPLYRDMAKTVPDGEKTLQMLVESKKVYAKMDDGFAFAMDYGPELSGSMIMGSSDAAGLMKEMIRLMENTAKMYGDAMESRVGAESEIGGHTFVNYTTKIDAAKMASRSGQDLPPEMAQSLAAMVDRMIGKDGMTSTIGIVDKHVVGTFGRGVDTAALVANMKSGTAAPDIVAQAIPELRVQPAVFFGMDLRKLMSQMAEMMQDLAPIPPVSAGDPVVVWMACGEKDGRTVGQLHVDLTGAVKLFMPK